MSRNSTKKKRVVKVSIKKPERTPDPDMVEVLKAIENMSSKDLARDNIVGKSTIDNWRKKKVRRPLHYTMNAVLQRIGKEFRIMDMKKSRQ